ncbi:hypothetical protein FQN49_004932 [Arthroderma sp. PD_2]|nr:hypothetical protein FQN49_004932 [Arthroderma sp. PD_2]
MQLPPTSVLLSWPQPNYENPSEVQGPAILILTLIFIPLTLAVICARVYTRVWISRSFGIDDILIIAATIAAVASGLTTLTAALRLGWDRHVYDVPFDQLTLGLKLLIVVEILFALGSGFTKLSLLCFTRRIMKGSANKSLEYAVILTMVVIGVYTIIFCFVVIFTCSPISDYWTLSAAPQNCLNEGAHLRASGVINTLTDLIVVLLPIPTVLSLKLYSRQRLVLALLFCTGFIICIAGVARTFFTYRISRSYDKTWDAYPLFIAATIEMYLGVIAASMPSLKPFFSRFAPTIFGSLFSRRDASSSLFSNWKIRRSGNSKARMFESSQATTVAGGDVEMDNQKSEMGMLSANFPGYGDSKLSLHSTDASSQSELRGQMR